MDEIFDRIKNTKIKHKLLATSLVIAELIGVFVLIWYLRQPLFERFLVTPPKSYTFESFDPQKRYLISRGDLLRGKKALPNSNILAIITPGKQKITAKADKNGEFTIQLPSDAQLGRYRITLANYDALKNLAWARSYKLTIKSNSAIANNNLVERLKF